MTPTASQGTLEQLFAVASGSVPGREHLGRGSLVRGRNNQDRALWSALPTALFLLVADGCGAGARSEVGADLGARLLQASAARHTARGCCLDEDSPSDGDVADLLAALRADLVDGLFEITSALGGPNAALVEEAFLFTVVGALVGRGSTILFAAGDGVWAVNQDLHRIGPFPDNAPPYLGYALLDASVVTASARPGPLEPLRVLATREVESLMVGTDGVVELAAAADRVFPGTRRLVGPLSRVWSEPRFTENPDALRRHLAMVNAERQVLDDDGAPRWSRGLLPDDTSLVVLRRRSRRDIP